MRFLAPILVLFGLAGLGSAVRAIWVGRVSSEPPDSDFVVEVLAGAVALHLYLNLLSLSGIRWSLLLLLLPIGVGAVAFIFPVVRRPWHGGWVRWLGWSEVFAVLAVATVAVLAMKLSIVNSDFIYHWGAKGQRFYLARAIDYQYLARPWNTPIDPNYPTLLPEIYAVTAFVAGRFAIPIAMSWTAIWLGLILLAACWLLRRNGDFLVQQVALGTLALVLGTLVLGMRLGGGADLLIALAMLAALPFPSGGDKRLDDWRIAACASFAAAAKLEGVVLGGILVSARAIWYLSKRPVDWPAILRTSLLPLIVVAHWSAQCLILGLASGHTFSFDRLDLGQAPVVGVALWQALGSERTYGLCYLVLLFPALLWARRARLAGVLILAQLAVYVAFYFFVPDPARYAFASFPRLVLHLLPAIITSVALVIPSRTTATGTDLGSPAVDAQVSEESELQAPSP